jgi:hypothetical protein
LDFSLGGFLGKLKSLLRRCLGYRGQANEENCFLDDVGVAFCVVPAFVVVLFAGRDVWSD